MIEIEKNEFTIRAGTFDEIVLKEQERYYNFDCTDKTILDLGGHIGTSAVKFAKNGAKKVFTFEPESENFDLLKRNIKNYTNIFAYEYAVVGDELIDKAKLYCNDFGHTGAFSMIPRNLWAFKLVECVFFPKLLDEIKPEIIKCDIEGMEYQLFNALPIIPHFIEDIVMEIHCFFESHYLLKKDLIEKLLKNNFEIIKNLSNEADFEVAYYYFKRK